MSFFNVSKSNKQPDFQVQEIEKSFNQSALEDKNHFLERILEASPNIIYIFDLIENKNIFTNNQMTRILGYSPEEIKEMGNFVLQKLIHPDDWELVQQNLKHMMDSRDKDDRVYYVEYRMKHADGSWHWLLSREVVFARTTKGKPKQMLGTAEDITACKNAKKALEESEERFRSAFENTSLGMAIVCLDGKWLRVNKALSVITGYTQEKLLTMTFVNMTHPDDQDKDYYCIGKLLARKASTCKLEKRYIHVQGHVVWVSMNVSLVRNAEGDPLYMIAQIQDITDSKLKEQELLNLKQIMDDEMECVSSLDADGNYIKVNKAYADICGYKPEEMIGLNWRKTIAPEDLNEAVEAYENMLENGKGEAQVQGIRKDNSLFLKKVILIRNLNKDGEFIGNYCFMKSGPH